MTITNEPLDHERAAIRHAEAVVTREEAERHAHELRERNESGDAEVTALDLLTASAEVKRLEGLELHAARQAEQAVARERVRLAQALAEGITEELSRPAVDGLGEDLTRSITDAVAKVFTTYAKRDQLCDEIGAALAAAGVSEGHTVGRLRYRAVRSDSGTRAIAGKFNVWLDGEPISRRQGVSDTRHTVHRLVELSMTDALRTNGLRWTPRGVEAV